MASEVQICNLALAHLGDSATVASINPPEGSAQAEHCARFYPIARDTLLEEPVGNWSFATRRVALSPLADLANSKWQYAYAVPNNTLRIKSLSHPDASSDQISETSMREGEPYTLDTRGTGEVIIRTNLEAAQAVLVMRVTDPTKFSATFINALSWRLASLLAGPVIKGKEGRAAAQFCEGMAMQWISRAAQIDASNHQEEKGVDSFGYAAPWHMNR